MRRKLALASFSLFVLGLVQPLAAQPGQPGQAGQRSPQSFGLIGDRPWFRDPAIRTQLGWTDAQFNRMNELYGTQFTRFRTATDSLRDLAERDRAQRMRDLTTNFYRDFNQGIGDALNADQRNRFNQLWMQYRGFDSFSDPTLQQRLRLTDEQNRQFSQLAERYNADFRQISSDTNDQNATRRFNELRQNLNQQINQVLTPDQQKEWRSISGDPYNFQWFSDRRAGADNPNRP